MYIIKRCLRGCIIYLKTILSITAFRSMKIIIQRGSGVPISMAPSAAILAYSVQKRRLRCCQMGWVPSAKLICAYTCSSPTPPSPFSCTYLYYLQNFAAMDKIWEEVEGDAWASLYIHLPWCSYFLKKKRYRRND